MHLMRKLMSKQHQPALPSCTYNVSTRPRAYDRGHKRHKRKVYVDYNCSRLTFDSFTAFFFVGFCFRVNLKLFFCCFFFHSIFDASLSAVYPTLVHLYSARVCCVFCHQTVNYGWIQACNLYIENMMARENHIEKWLQLSSQLFTPIAL